MGPATSWGKKATYSSASSTRTGTGMRRRYASVISEMAWKVKNEMPTGSATSGRWGEPGENPSVSSAHSTALAPKPRYLKSASVKSTALAPAPRMKRRARGEVPGCSRAWATSAASRERPINTGRKRQSQKP